MWEGKKGAREGGQGCCLLSRLSPSIDPRWLLCGAERELTSADCIQELGDKFGHVSVTPMSRLGSSCHARPGAQASAPRPWRRANDL